MEYGSYSRQDLINTTICRQAFRYPTLETMIDRSHKCDPGNGSSITSQSERWQSSVYRYMATRECHALITIAHWYEEHTTVLLISCCGARRPRVVPWSTSETYG